MGGKELEITGAKSADYAVPGEELPLPVVGLWGVEEKYFRVLYVFSLDSCLRSMCKR